MPAHCLLGDSRVPLELLNFHMPWQHLKMSTCSELNSLQSLLSFLFQKCHQLVTFLTNVTNKMALRMSPSLNWNEKTALRCFMPPCTHGGPRMTGEVLLALQGMAQMLPSQTVLLALLSPSMFSFSLSAGTLKIPTPLERNALLSLGLLPSP